MGSHAKFGSSTSNGLSAYGKHLKCDHRAPISRHPNRTWRII